MVIKISEALDNFIFLTSSGKPREVKNGYMGIYEEEFIQMHCIKIIAKDEEDARDKFVEYLKKESSLAFTREELSILPYGSIQIIQ